MAKRRTPDIQKNANAVDGERFLRLDALRGLAIVWMTVFHFCFDLNYFGFLKQNFYEDHFWTYQRTCIVSLFLFCAGSGQAVAFERQLSWPRFMKRWRQIFAASVLVTIGSYFVYPQSFIYFGILHGIAAMLLILKILQGKFAHYLPLGVVLILFFFTADWAFSQFPGLEILNEKWLNWIGYISRKPITEDYVPLFPWLGVLFIGFGIGQWILKNRRTWFSGELKSNFRPLAVLGQWSLSYYLIHQPVLFGAVMLAKKLIG